MKYTFLIFLMLASFISGFTTAVSTVEISTSEITVGQEVTFTYIRETSCGAPSSLFVEGTETSADVGSVIAQYNNNPLGGTDNLKNGVSMWTHTYTTPGEYYIWFECEPAIGNIQSNGKAGKALPLSVVPAINGLPGAGGNFNRIVVTNAANVPTLSQWGIIALSLLLLTFAVVSIKSNRQVSTERRKA